MDQANPVLASIGATNATPIAFALSLVLPLANRRDLAACGAPFLVPGRIEQHISADGSQFLRSFPPKPAPRVLSLTGTGGRKAPHLPGEHAQAAGIWAGDASSPANLPSHRAVAGGGMPASRRQNGGVDNGKY